MCKSVEHVICETIYISSENSVRPKRLRRVIKKTPLQTFCLCKQTNNPEKPMVQCRMCLDWFHYDCVNFSGTPKSRRRTFECPRCAGTPKCKDSTNTSEQGIKGRSAETYRCKKRYAIYTRYMYMPVYKRECHFSLTIGSGIQ